MRSITPSECKSRRRDLHPHHPVYKTGALLNRATSAFQSGSATSTSARICTLIYRVGAGHAAVTPRTCMSSRPEGRELYVVVTFRAPRSSTLRSQTSTSCRSACRVPRRAAATTVDAAPSAAACQPASECGPPFACCTPYKPGRSSPRLTFHPGPEEQRGRSSIPRSPVVDRSTGT